MVCPVDDCVPTAIITYAQNDSIDNSHAGFNISENILLGTASVIVQNNYALGAGIGFDQFFSDGRDPPGLLGFQPFTQNNFYGNDRNRPPLSIETSQDRTIAPLDPGPSARRCLGCVRRSVRSTRRQDDGDFVCVGRFRDHYPLTADQVILMDVGWCADTYTGSPVGSKAFRSTYRQSDLLPDMPPGCHPTCPTA